MHFVGLDLAWGKKNRTGIAVVDSDGRLVLVDAAWGDAEIVDVIAPYVDGDCLVAIDAPLIVQNATGQRLAESELNAVYGKFQAGAHSANTSMPHFANGSRGAHVAATLGLDIDPRSLATRRAIEVYPHPATIALFELGTTLKYKKKWPMDKRQNEFQRLISFIEELAEHLPALHVSQHDVWVSMRQQIETATKPVQLNNCEDPVDGVLCAYIASFVHYRPQDVVMYGNAEDGYIITPRLPEGLKPQPSHVESSIKPKSASGGDISARLAAAEASIEQIKNEVAELREQLGG